MKILCVPDVHGRKFWRKAIELIDKVDKIIFLGDYLDPYSYEEISFEQATSEFIDIIEFKKQYPDKVILLTGNHCWHYINKDFPDCSRRNYDKLDEINKLFNENINLFQLIYETDKYLFSHAGIYENWMNLCNFTLDDLKNWNNILKNDYLKLSICSYIRGGFSSTGSCIWADIRESLNNYLYSDKIQVVGHTQLQDKPYITENIICLDCRRCFILTDDGISEIENCI